MLDARFERKFDIINEELKRIFHDDSISHQIRLKAGRLAMDLFDDMEIFMRLTYRSDEMKRIVREYETEVTRLYSKF